MFNGLELLFNLIWVGLIVVGAIITIAILRRKDPFDDARTDAGNGLPDEDDLYVDDTPSQR